MLEYIVVKKEGDYMTQRERMLSMSGIYNQIRKYSGVSIGTSNPASYVVGIINGSNLVQVLGFNDKNKVNLESSYGAEGKELEKYLQIKSKEEFDYNNESTIIRTLFDRGIGTIFENNASNIVNYLRENNAYIVLSKSTGFETQEYIDATDEKLMEYAQKGINPVWNEQGQIKNINFRKEPIERRGLTLSIMEVNFKKDKQDIFDIDSVVSTDLVYQCSCESFNETTLKNIDMEFADLLNRGYSRSYKK